MPPAAQETAAVRLTRQTKALVAQPASTFASAEKGYQEARMQLLAGLLFALVLVADEYEAVLTEPGVRAREVAAALAAVRPYVGRTSSPAAAAWDLLCKTLRPVLIKFSLYSS